MIHSHRSGNAIEYMSGDVFVLRTRLPSACHHICKNMAHLNHRELDWMGLNEDDALSLIRRSHEAYLVTYKGESVFYFGTNVPVPHQRWLWGFGTPKTRRVIPALSRWARERWIPRLFEKEGVMRVEMRVSDYHDFGWFKRLGMVEEGRLKYVGTTDDQFVQMAFTREDYAKLVQSSRVQGASSCNPSSPQNHAGGSD